MRPCWSLCLTFVLNCCHTKYKPQKQPGWLQLDCALWDRFQLDESCLFLTDLPASFIISAIQYTFVERLVSELGTSILTPSSMSPQQVPIGAWRTRKNWTYPTRRRWIHESPTQIQVLLTCLKQLTGAPTVLLLKIYFPQSKVSAGTANRTNRRCRDKFSLNVVTQKISRLPFDDLPAFDLAWFSWFAWYWA